MKNYKWEHVRENYDCFEDTFKIEIKLFTIHCELFDSL